MLDPGLGFSKRAEHNWQLLAHLDVLDELGLPVLIGASRKRFLAGALPADAPVAGAGPAHRGGQRTGRAGGRLGGPGARRRGHAGGA